MKKFWRWIIKNNYSRIGNRTAGIYLRPDNDKLILYYNGHIFKDNGEYNNNLLIGFMIEYIKQHKFWKKRDSKTLYMKYYFDRCCAAIDIYSELKYINGIIQVSPVFCKIPHKTVVKYKSNHPPEKEINLHAAHHPEWHNRNESQENGSWKCDT